MKDIMGRSGLGAATPYPVPGLVAQKVLVMTRLFGHKVCFSYRLKGIYSMRCYSRNITDVINVFHSNILQVTDQTALMLHNVDREALLCRLAHCSAYQLLVAGVFNGKKLLIFLI